MTLFNDWCDKKFNDPNNTSLWEVTEKKGGRAAIEKLLYTVVRSHYDDLDRIADTVNELGYKAAEKILRGRIPQTKKARSGDLGEILATEFAKEEFQFDIPVKRLRYKDGREMALRGDDFIGIRYSKKDGLYLLKGESKSRINLTKSTLQEARGVLDRDNGRCTPSSLSFVMDRLLESTDPTLQEIGKAVRKELAMDSLKPDRITHALITLSGNSAVDIIKADLDSADGSRSQFGVNIFIPDHANFIKLTFEGVGKLGKS
ncbi:uncharacterized protein DUF1837 [Arcticibacter tournemirensis]|uniref:DUF1837 domain-containing protein n=1 Tax=Arcticibacter tournemirensis TaxID=699437 RepID=A0A5M9GJX8_9SPHI|nr:Hachiman antiphage defense system protein HamA [Arcticibacter tournemirensis]KAA8474836.1 DUF1837 domain-containing protein [Arcticibacter tournemirensis]TQM49639.1 uncharacterized protein DUF1837 [Arcticibacter tournemirensis]